MFSSYIILLTICFVPYNLLLHREGEKGLEFNLIQIDKPTKPPPPRKDTGASA